MNSDVLSLITGLYGSESQPSPSGLGATAQEADAASFAGGLDLGVNPARKRRTKLQNTMLTIADLFNISASRPNVFGQSALEPGSAYLGQSEEQANKRQKIRMEEDPEGHQIDLNRAKVLSQKAYQETDPLKKAIYGREIKKLLPEETQGLDDVTAADMFTSNEKIELERYKQMGRMQLQESKNRNAYDVASLKTMSAEQINREKLNVQWDIAKLKAEYNKAIQEGKNDTALTIQEMITDRQYDLHMMDNAAKLKQTEIQQTNANFRTVTQQEGQTTRALAQNASREEIARMQAETAREQIAGRQKVAEINAEARKTSGGDNKNEQAMVAGFAENLNPDFLQKMRTLNYDAGRWGTNKYDPSDKSQGWLARQYIALSDDDYGIDASNNTKEAQDYQEFESYARQIVSNQLKKILGGQFTQVEGDKVFASFGINPTMDPSVRWSAFINGMNNLAARYGLKVRVDESGNVFDLGQETKTKKTNTASQLKSEGGIITLTFD